MIDEGSVIGYSQYMDSDTHRKLTLPKIISFFLLFLVLAAVPVTVIILGQRTRQQIKAASACKEPTIPDPIDCVRGEWKLYKNAEGCVRFRCETTP